MPSVACGTRRGAAAQGLPGKPPCTVAPCRTASMFCLHLLHGNAVRAVLRADTCRFVLPNGTYRHPAEAVSRGCFCSSANGWLPGCWLAAYSVRNMFTHSAPPLPWRGACCRTAATATGGGAARPGHKAMCMAAASPGVLHNASMTRQRPRSQRQSMCMQAGCQSFGMTMAISKQTLLDIVAGW